MGINMRISLWWHMPLIPVLGRQRQVNFCEFKPSLVYIDFQGCTVRHCLSKRGEGTREKRTFHSVCIICMHVIDTPMYYCKQN